MAHTAKRILWVDDEVELLRPHVLFLQQRGYMVDLSTNGDDALALLRIEPYDLILLDEQMPGRSGIEVLTELRKMGSHARVVMVSKSEEEATIAEAIGREVADYLVKPTSPRQVLSVVTRLLEGGSLVQQRLSRDFTDEFRELNERVVSATHWRQWTELYGEMVDWELRLVEAGETGLLDALASLHATARVRFGDYIADHYASWVRPGDPVADRPVLSIDLVKDVVAPILVTPDDRLLFVVVDCLRLDQWRRMATAISDLFNIDEALYCSVLPTATPVARNAIFGGLWPDEIEVGHPGWWSDTDDDTSMNAFEESLLVDQLKRVTGRDVPVRYEKIVHARGSDDFTGRVSQSLRKPGVTALVFNFIDLLTHGRAESSILMEFARDAEALRALSLQWFQRSPLLEILRDASRQGVKVVLTTDHGSIHCFRPLTVFARRDASPSLRFKHGEGLRAEAQALVWSTSDPADLRLPVARQGVNWVIARDDGFFVYPTKLREYQHRYRGSFLHGGISPEEMILPVALLTPR